MHRAYFGMLPPLMFGGAGKEPEPVEPPSISRQPQTYQLYQAGGPLMISIEAENYKSIVWQRLIDGEWSDTELTGKVVEYPAAGNSAAGRYRVKLIGLDSQNYYSQEAETVSAYLAFRNDVSPNDPNMVKVSNQEYNYTVARGGRYLSGFYFNAVDGSQFTPKGLTSSRAIAQWSSTNAAVANVGTGQPGNGIITATGQYAAPLNAGTTVMTASVGSLSSNINITVT